MSKNHSPFALHSDRLLIFASVPSWIYEYRPSIITIFNLEKWFWVLDYLPIARPHRQDKFKCVFSFVITAESAGGCFGTLAAWKTRNVLFFKTEIFAKTCKFQVRLIIFFWVSLGDCLHCFGQIPKKFHYTLLHTVWCSLFSFSASKCRLNKTVGDNLH